MWLFGGFSIWVIAGILYGIAVICCWVRENAQMKQRESELEERRRIQNAEWDAQLRSSPTLRLLIALSNNAREELRELRREDRETLEALRASQRSWVVGKHKQKIDWDWKEEGF